MPLPTPLPTTAPYSTTLSLRLAGPVGRFLGKGDAWGWGPTHLLARHGSFLRCLLGLQRRLREQGLLRSYGGTVVKIKHKH